MPSRGSREARPSVRQRNRALFKQVMLSLPDVWEAGFTNKYADSGSLLIVGCFTSMDVS